MSYKLVITEKPSVAQSIAKVIGADKREDGYLEGNGYIVSWCVGHLVELASPESYDEKYEKWRYEDLPILPSEWNYQIAEATRKQFGILKRLMESRALRPDTPLPCAGPSRCVWHRQTAPAACGRPFPQPFSAAPVPRRHSAAGSGAAALPAAPARHPRPARP